MLIFLRAPSCLTPFEFCMLMWRFAALWDCLFPPLFSPRRCVFAALVIIPLPHPAVNEPVELSPPTVCDDLFCLPHFPPGTSDGRSPPQSSPIILQYSSLPATLAAVNNTTLDTMEDDKDIPYSPSALLSACKFARRAGFRRKRVPRLGKREA